MAGGLDTCIANVFEPGNIPASSGETPVRVPLPTTLKRTVLEAATATAEQDATAFYAVMLIVEAAHASDTVDGEVEIIELFADVVEAAAADAEQASPTVIVADMLEAAAAAAEQDWATDEGAMTVMLPDAYPGFVTGPTGGSPLTVIVVEDTY